ncbi:MAG: AsmA-like C-terminal region-containing protein [Chthoniobacteraceae bacterium]
MRRKLKTILILFLLLFVVALVWGGWYVNRKGFNRHWRQFVNSEFEKRGLSVSISRLTLDPFHGLVARDVEIYDVKSHHRMLAVISQIVLDINYSNLFRHKPFLNGLDLRDTKLLLPLDPSNPSSQRIQISNLNARVQLPPNQFYLSKADANVLGIHVTVTGRLIYPEAFHMASENADVTRKQKNDSGEILEGVIDRIRALRFESGAPQLDISFSGDARDMATISVKAILRSEEVRSEHADYRLQNIRCVLNYQDGVLDLKKCVARDKLGTLDAGGKWEPSTGAGDFQIHSTLDVQALSHAFNLVHALDEFSFYEPPTIELSGEWNTRNKDVPPFTLIGRLALKKFGFQSVIFDSFNANFSWDGARWYARDIKLSHRTGTLTAKAEQLPDSFRADIQSTLNPSALLPIFPGKVAEALSEFKFIDAPKVLLSVRGPGFDFDKCITTGSLQIGQAVLRGSQMDRAQCNLLVKDRAVTYQNFRIERGNGVATGGFTYDFAKHEIRLDKIKNNINPQDVAPWINPDIVKNVAPYRFKTPPDVFINGVVQFAGGKNTNLDILVDAPGGMDYTFLRRNLSFSSVSGRLFFTDGHLKLTINNGNLFSGSVKGTAEISLDRNSPFHSAKIEAKNIDFAKLTKLYFDYDNSHGQFSGDYSFSIRSDDPRTMQGEGKLVVLNGNIFSIPFLGPITAILNSIVPGMGYDVARKATASFRLHDSVIETKDFIVMGKGFDMTGKGKLFFLDDKMDFGIRINAHGLTGVLLRPVSELFEYTSDGSLSKPVWRPKRLPSF